MSVKSLSLAVDTFSGRQDVELKLTRKSVVNAERKGILDLQKAQSAPIAYNYALTYAAIASTYPQIKQDAVDDALDRYFSNGGTVEALSEVLIGQYASLFNTAEVSDGNIQEY